jgi:hypothetical protein
MLHFEVHIRIFANHINSPSKRVRLLDRIIPLTGGNEARGQSTTLIKDGSASVEYKTNLDSI